MRRKANPAVESLPNRDASFIQPMECLPVPKLPEGSLWVYEVKLDGFRAIGVNPKKGKPTLLSRQDKSFDRKFPDVSKALATLSRGTVIDGEVVALDDAGRPDFNLLTHSRKSASRIRFYVFDLLSFKNKDIMALPLLERRKLLQSLAFESEIINLLEYFQTSAGQMLDVVRQHCLEGVVAKRLDSPYEPGQRSGAWVKHRIAQQDDFWIGGYIPGSHGIDSLIVGNYSGNKLMYVSRVRAGLVTASRITLFRKLRGLTVEICPFANLPEHGRSRWGENLTAEKMKQCVWVEPKLTARIEFLERTEAGRLRHSRFVRLND
jgi:DNA ligase D-like protein (predicted ligase)